MICQNIKVPIPIKYEINSKHIESIPTENKCHLQLKITWKANLFQAC